MIQRAVGELGRRSRNRQVRAQLAGVKRDRQGQIAGAGVGDWFDILLRIRTVTPTHRLP
jgi:hypothetical protein